jgi:uncharacterized membrane protein
MSLMGEGYYWPWLALAALGAYHGLNPAMGWLFAVALGLQERRLGAVLQAFPPIALGHILAISAAVLVVGVAQIVVPLDALRYACASVLILFGLYKLIRRKHPRWVGMRVGFKDLTLWSFLMASAHGAGLMLFPVLLHNELDGINSLSAAENLLAVSLHTAAMLVTMAAIALLVYEKLGVGVLRKAWLNLDALWATAIIAAGALTLFT